MAALTKSQYRKESQTHLGGLRLSLWCVWRGWVGSRPSQFLPTLSAPQLFLRPSTSTVLLSAFYSPPARLHASFLSLPSPPPTFSCHLSRSQPLSSPLFPPLTSSTPTPPLTVLPLPSAHVPHPSSPQPLNGLHPSSSALEGATSSAPPTRTSRGTPVTSPPAAPSFPRSPEKTRRW